MSAADPRRTAAWHPPAPRHQDNGRSGPGRVRVIDVRPGGRHARDRAHAWLRSAMIALAVLAAAAAAVSWDAQYVLVRAVKQNTAVAALEAGIPDVGALIFASLGVALALHGKRAIRARVLNVGCVGISLAMNAIASAQGWRDLAIWVMPSAVYALASDTLIGVIRAWVIARERRSGQALADDEASPMAIVGGLFLWLLRLALAPPSTKAQRASPLVGRPYDLRHGGVTLALNAGVPAPEVANRAGHSVEVLWRIYAGCIDGHEPLWNQRIEEALSDGQETGNESPDEH